MAAKSNMRLIQLFEKIRQTDPENELLMEICKRHDKYGAESLVLEIREDASNTIGRWFSGAVDYDEVVNRVAKKVGIKENELKNNEKENEILILGKILQDYIKKNPKVEGDLRRLAKEANDESEEIIKAILAGSTSAFLSAVLIAGPVVTRQIILRIMAYFVTTQTALTVARIATLAIPFLNAAMAAWLIFDISGPAYRKIVPSVLNIAILRLQIDSEESKLIALKN